MLGGGAFLTLASVSPPAKEAHAADFVDTDNLLSAVTAADCVTALAIQFKEWRDLPCAIFLTLWDSGARIPLIAARTRWGVVHTANFQAAGKCLTGGLYNHAMYMTPRFWPDLQGKIPLVATPARSFATRLLFHGAVYEELGRRPPGVYDLPAFVKPQARVNPMSVVDLSTGAKRPDTPVADSLAWEKGMQFTYSAYELAVLSVRDGLAEEVLRLLNGSRASHYQGAYNTKRIMDHGLKVTHIHSRL